MGRNRGSKNITDVQTVDVPRCRALITVDGKSRVCGSTEAKILGTNIFDYEGFDANGNPYNKIVRRRTLCLNPACGQVRIDRSLEYQPPAPAKEPEQPPADPPQDDDGPVEFIDPETEVLPVEQK